MLPEMTPAVARALEVASQWAQRLKAAAVEPLHLLLALVEEEDGRAATLLRQAGADLAAFRRAWSAPAPGELPATALPMAATSEAILADVGALAREVAVDGSVASEMLLQTLLRADAALRTDLVSCGLDFSQLEAAIAVLFGPPLQMEEPLNLTEPAETVDAARILDAAANRAREALRVIEDYCRFVLDDAFLSGSLKELRHDLARILAEVDPGQAAGLGARDTLGDVGTTLTTESEHQRYSLASVVQANCKRLQEALRTLEEYGKLFGPEVGRGLEALRYRSYTLEKAVILGGSVRQRLRDARLYLLLTASACTHSVERTIAEAAEGGVQIVQLREKELSDGDLLERARQMRRWTRTAGVLFIVNDRPDVARLVEADGVHLGQDDMSVKDARRIVGAEVLIGVSTHNRTQLRRAVLDGASYVGVGPTFASGTKAFEELAGLEYVRQAAAETSLPAFVIGGVNLETIGAAVAAGARRVAVSQAICQSQEPRQLAAALRRHLDAN